MTESNEQGQPLGLASTAGLGLVERLRQRRVTSWVHSTGTTPKAIGTKPDPLCQEAGLAIDKALHEAIAAIHFDDSSDYARALRRIVRYLGGPECAELLEADPKACYDKSKAESLN